MILENKDGAKGFAPFELGMGAPFSAKGAVGGGDLLTGEIAAGIEEKIETGESGGAGEGIGGIGMSVQEGMLMKGAENFLGAGGGSKGEEAAGDPLGEADEVGGEVLAGEEGTGAAKSGHHFVCDRQDIVFFAAAEEGF